MVNARKQADYYNKVIVPLSEHITLETQLQYNAMQLGILQLLQAKKNEFDFKRNQIEAMKKYWIARAEIELFLQGYFIRQPLCDVSANGEMVIRHSLY